MLVVIMKFVLLFVILVVKIFNSYYCKHFYNCLKYTFLCEICNVNVIGMLFIKIIWTLNTQWS